MQTRSTVPFRHGAREACYSTLPARRSDRSRFSRAIKRGSLPISNALYAFPTGVHHGHIATTCGYVPAKVWCSWHVPPRGNGRDPRMDGVRPSRAAKRGALLVTGPLNVAIDIHCMQAPLPCCGLRAHKAIMRCKPVQSACQSCIAIGACLATRRLACCVL